MAKSKVFRFGVPIIAALLLLTAYLYGIAPKSDDGTSVSDEQALTMQTFEKYRSLIAQMPSLEKRLSMMKNERAVMGEAFLTGETVSLAGANLQETVRGFITENGGSINSEKINKPEPKEGVTVVSVGVDAVFPDIEALRRALHGILTASKRIVIDELDVRVTDLNAPRALAVKISFKGLSTAV